jgi:hypothetical protein
MWVAVKPRVLAVLYDSSRDQRVMQVAGEPPAVFEQGPVRLAPTTW